MKLKSLIFLSLGFLTLNNFAKDEPKEKCQLGYPMATVNTIADVLTERGAQEKLGIFKGYVSMINSVLVSEGKDWRRNPVSTVTLSGQAVREGDISCGTLTLSITRTLKPTNDPYTPTEHLIKFKLKTSELFDYCRDDVKKAFGL